MDIIGNLVLQLTDACNCDFSMQYVADPILKCEMDGYAIFQARIISTAENTSTDFLPLLQAWASDEPLVVVNLVEIMLVMVCSAPVNDTGETECIAPTTTMTPEVSSVSLAAIVAPVMISLVLITLIIIVIITSTIWYYFRWLQGQGRAQGRGQGQGQNQQPNDILNHQDQDENQPLNDILNHQDQENQPLDDIPN